ncbi:hypothetical protein [Candidatus Formimonas warabiya]|uniref:Nucleoside 2-deoxyribosyltransferase n=1 Tax=Formimonas warabiya TaxID=1761012 RepID=A0A3G1KXL9_FORW1|nr:hypothetical protein [Candidatus Formimonas warabiya]ATW26955.1 hypothetical protein DCMF_21280 [Candidatus Formimonas warabiya]
MRIYISASWKKRVLVRELAETLRAHNHEVFDFTDPECRRNHETPPEMFPEQFDPVKHIYSQYLNRKEWRNAVNENREAIKWADLIILLLPCGIDATADWALGIGMGKHSIIVGYPDKGDRSEVHLWADALLNSVEEVVPWLEAHMANKKTG